MLFLWIILLREKGRLIVINYATQVSVAPPKFVLFCNYPELIHFSYARYIENKFRVAFGFDGSPIMISFLKVKVQMNKKFYKNIFF